ncbi:MAG: methylmalonyl-CoA mutase family protein, partial [candidate division NC10 bacterium]|nr:methylmalonyl-CoA mutase family protein [candidate division NC10 bacterium]
AYREQAQVEGKSMVVVGLNEYTTAEAVRIPTFRVDQSIEAGRRRSLGEVRGRRDQRAVGRALVDLETAARADANLVPFILAAVKAYATIGEICRVLRQVFGEHRETITV